ncbi:hypothetical protein FHT80_005799 [Rhizobium sp. BK226]|uniref:hypothetical protein n=1 Tax=Rhizobium sp. BK226 TaxID=2587075 RepID=UPI00161F458A|nr:hypothetical protein [Rhizobium sp. BK226]MBB4116425.1 hypothetical protein [Rhizobium sp. BK226]
MSQFSPETIFKIFVTGHVDDLFALSLLFHEGAMPDFYVVTAIEGEKDRLFDRVTNVDNRQTYVSGPGCAPLFDFLGQTTQFERDLVAREIIAPLNGFAALTDSNFKPVVPVSASYDSRGGSGHMSLGTDRSNRPTRAIVTNRHPRLQELMPSRVSLILKEPLVAKATAVIAGPPSWSEYYRILEDIAGHRNTSLERLAEKGLAARLPLVEFKKAANNHIAGRHGASKRDSSLLADDMMNLLEAREFVRSVVTKWIDDQCGTTFPTDRVDGGPLRFGLDDDN